YFTTKETGTGLGLAMVAGIVQRHRGWIELESTPGSGTRFRILLPAAMAAPPSATAPPSSPEPAGRGSETILFVEDEAAVREFAVAVLKSHGYRVLQACSGTDALDVWQRHASRISLLVTDLVMPDGLSGVELAGRLRKENPALKVILTSGYANGLTGREFQPPGNMDFLQKPYKPQALAQTVRTALDVDSVATTPGTRPPAPLTPP
ncbi:MAG TPA: response regulator, partial [Rariglobus sp.]